MADQHRVWDAIAASFSRTRQRPWPHVADFIATLPAKSRVLDLMAGNGRHTKTLADAGHDAVAFDWSRPLLADAPRGSQVAGDAVALPFADASFDAAIYVAGLHGLTTAHARRASLHELRRVLRPGAPVQVTVWSRDAPRFAGLDLPPGPCDVAVPWRAAGLDEVRHYHLYTSAALRDALAAAGFVEVRIEAVAVAAKEPDNLVATARHS